MQTRINTVFILITIVNTHNTPGCGHSLDIFKILDSQWDAGKRAHRFSPAKSCGLRCGLGAGACEAALCQTPNQSIQIKLLHDASPAVSVKQYSHLPFFRACAAIARTHGVLSFYDGLGPAVAKGALTNSVRFVGYKGITRQLDGPPTPLLYPTRSPN